MDIVLIVDPAQAGQRLDRILSDALPDRSRGASWTASRKPRFPAR